MHWATSFLRHGNASHCDVYCDPFTPDGCSCQQGSPVGPGDVDRGATADRRGADEPARPTPADELDSTPTAYPAPARLSEFIAVRDRHPVNPTAGLSPAAAGDSDHTISVRNGGTTTRDNLTSPTRRWHLLTTHGDWTVERVGRQWRWTSPSGHTYTTEPHDYGRGP